MVKYARPRSLSGTPDRACEVCFRSKTEGGHISPYSVYNLFTTYFTTDCKVYKAIVSLYNHTAIFSKAIFLSMHLLFWMNFVNDFICKFRGIGPWKEGWFNKYCNVVKRYILVQASFNKKSFVIHRTNVSQVIYVSGNKQN